MKRFYQFLHSGLRSTLFLLLAFVLFGSVVGQPTAPGKIKDLRPTVILVGIDGFRYDYFEKFGTPNLDRLAAKGVRARWMTPSYPSKTFPNFYTIATGLYPEQHGIVENNIYDFGTQFSMGNKSEVQNARWWLGEPIWVTAEKNGLRAAPFFYPGSEAAIGGRHAAFWAEYQHTMPADEKIAQLMQWIDLPVAERPQYLSLYFHDVDTAGHHFGPDSLENRRAVLDVDVSIGRLIAELKRRGIENRVNIVVVSDHGMAAADWNNVVLLDKYFDLSLAERILYADQIVQIFPQPGQKDNILQKLAGIEHAECLAKESISARFRYSAGVRVAPIICRAETGWAVTNAERFAETSARPDFTRMHGEHGYDNEDPEMRAIFVGRGPAFKKAGKMLPATVLGPLMTDGFLRTAPKTKKARMVEPFANIEVYNILCHILGIPPAPNSGHPDMYKGILRK